jgi:hypothetical protein
MHQLDRDQSQKVHINVARLRVPMYCVTHADSVTQNIRSLMKREGAREEKRYRKEQKGTTEGEEHETR